MLSSMKVSAERFEDLIASFHAERGDTQDRAYVEFSLTDRPRVTEGDASLSNHQRLRLLGGIEQFRPALGALPLLRQVEPTFRILLTQDFALFEAKLVNEIEWVAAVRTANRGSLLEMLMLLESRLVLAAAKSAPGPELGNYVVTHQREEGRPTSNEVGATSPSEAVWTYCALAYRQDDPMTTFNRLHSVEKRIPKDDWTATAVAA